MEGENVPARALVSGRVRTEPGRDGVVSVKKGDIVPEVLTSIVARFPKVWEEVDAEVALDPPGDSEEEDSGSEEE